jgi:hypothetical protein
MKTPRKPNSTAYTKGEIGSIDSSTLHKEVSEKNAGVWTMRRAGQSIPSYVRFLFKALTEL